LKWIKTSGGIRCCPTQISAGELPMVAEEPAVSRSVDSTDMWSRDARARLGQLLPKLRKLENAYLTLRIP
jgi:hypothetical protein